MISHVGQHEALETVLRCHCLHNILIFYSANSASLNINHKIMKHVSLNEVPDQQDKFNMQQSINSNTIFCKPIGLILSLAFLGGAISGTFQGLFLILCSVDTFLWNQGTIQPLGIKPRSEASKATTLSARLSPQSRPCTFLTTKPY